jgi:hypothetical protein
MLADIDARVMCYPEVHLVARRSALSMRAWSSGARSGTNRVLALRPVPEVDYPGQVVVCEADRSGLT